MTARGVSDPTARRRALLEIIVLLDEARRVPAEKYPTVRPRLATRMLSLASGTAPAR
jgi:hypothetical protein